MLLAGGTEKARELPIPGRELKGIHLAMDFLPQQNRRVSGEPPVEVEPILADRQARRCDRRRRHRLRLHRHVVPARREVGHAVEILPQPPEKENKALSWPDWPLKLRTSSSQEEGAERDFAS